MVDGFRLSLQTRERPLSKTTIDNYTLYARTFLRWCREHEIDYLKVTRYELNMYLGALAESHAESTVYLTGCCLRYFYAYLLEEGLIDTNPMERVKAKRPREKDAEPFTQAEMLKMYQACRDFREQAVFLLVAGSGLRRKEVWGICRDDVDFGSGTVTVTGKGDKVRQVRPGALTMEALKLALTFEEDLCPFKSVEWVWWTIRNIAKRAGVRGRVYVHRFRHNFATKWLDEGGTVEELAEVLGHSSVSMSLRYARAGRKQRALNRMDALDMTQRILGK